MDWITGIIICGLTGAALLGTFGVVVQVVAVGVVALAILSMGA